ncbi:MAG: hypothetical protein KHY44_09705 [Clostridiales bacterium]|nr:hypothetical protein [Clostridiales bacterium]
MLEALWNWVLLTSFYGSVVGVVLLLAKELLGKKITPRWHYALWGF